MEKRSFASIGRLFSPSEAAALNDIAVKIVHNAIDKRIVSSQAVDRRALAAGDLLRLRIWHGIGSRLSSQARSALFDEIARQPDAHTLRLDPFIIVDLQTARDALKERINDLEAAEAAIEETPGVAGGEPVFKGTRVPVRPIARMLANGVVVAEILEGYPALDGKALAFAAMWAKAHPARGRPKTFSEQGLTPKDTRRVPFSASLPSTQDTSDA